MRQGINQGIDQVGSPAHHLRIFAAHRINTIAVVSEHGRNFIGIKSSGIHHAPRLHGFCFKTLALRPIAKFNFYRDTVRPCLQAFYTRVGQDAGAPIARQACEGFHQFFRGYDRSRGHFQRGCGPNVGLALADSLLSHQLQALDSIGSPVFRKLFELGNFGFVTGDNNFPAIAVRDPVCRAEFFGQPIPFHTKSSFEEFRRIVDTRMNYAAVARTGGHAQPRRLLQQKHIFDPAGKLVCDGAAHHATANDDDINSIHWERTRALVRCESRLRGSF